MRLVTFGDSWPCGAELAPWEKPYGKLLSEKYNLEYINMAQNATSIDNMILQLDQYLKLKHQKDLSTTALFFITSYTRAMFWYNGQPIRVYPYGPACSSEEHKHIATHYYHIHSDELDQHRANVSILSLQKMCSEFNIADYYFIGWIKPNFNYSGINLDKIYGRGLISAADWLGADDSSEFTLNKKNIYVYPNCDHPNQLGHQLIADKINEWIKF